MGELHYSWKRKSAECVTIKNRLDNDLNAHVQKWGNGVLRLTVNERPVNRRPPFLMGKGEPVIPDVQEKYIEFNAGSSSLCFYHDRGWKFINKKQTILKEPDDFFVPLKGIAPVVPTLNAGKNSSDISFLLQPDEPVYGGGETFGYLNKRKLKTSLSIIDPSGLTTTEHSYKHVPLFWSPLGWGVFICTSHKVHADIGRTSYTDFHLNVQEPVLDLFFIPGRPGEIIKQYWKLTGEPPLPPRWGLGVWWSRCMYQNKEEVREVVEGLEKHHIRGDVISLDPMWLENRPKWGRDACDFKWSDEKFGPLSEFSEWLRKKGFRLCLWENPYVWLEGESKKEFSKWLMRDKNSEIVNVEPPLCNDRNLKRMKKLGAWDLTDKKSYQARKEYISGLVRRGASTFKADYGESVPGEEIHNLYAYLYLKNTWEGIAEELGESDAMIWARPGWSGCQKYAGCWAGDSQSTFPAMASTLAGCLSLAASGFSWWSHDIGGFHHYSGKTPSTELYLRWAEWGLLSPLARFHGTTPREPWHFGEEAVQAVKKLVNLRYRLIPFIEDSYKKLLPRGLPVCRPLVMDYPEDEATWNCSTEYLFGEGMLIAPILVSGEKQRKVYLPEGEWKRYGSKKFPVIQGPDSITCSSQPGSPIIFEKV